MPEGGDITIETANLHADDAWCAIHPSMAPGPYITLNVRDTGKTMDSATPTWTSDPSGAPAAQGTGAGLELAAIYGIVEQAGGCILAESEAGKGTTFRVCLPRFAAEPAAR